MAVKLNSTGGGSVTLDTPSTASNYTVTLPTANTTLADTSSTQTLTNKTLTAAGSNTVEATSGPTSSQLAGNRNKIINGAMMIDQRNAGASVANGAGSSYSLDRWKIYGSQASKFTVQRNAGSVTPPVGYSYYLGVTSSSAYSVGAAELFQVYQNIEAFNIADLGWGAVGAKSVTLSFQVYSSLTGTFSGFIQNNAGNRSYPFSYSISSANTWTPISVTISGDTTGTWFLTSDSNGVGLTLALSLGIGSNYNGTAGAWAAGDFRTVSGSTSVVGTNGATFYITGVQLEKGATVTPFENRLITTELQLCQRYFCKSGPFDSAIQSPGAAYGNPFFVASTLNAYTANNGYVPPVYFPVNMRTTPTVVTVPTSLGTGATSNGQITGYNAGATTWVTATALIQSSSAVSFNLACTGTWSAAATLSYYGWTASAEL